MIFEEKSSVQNCLFKFLLKRIVMLDDAPEVAGVDVVAVAEFVSKGSFLVVILTNVLTNNITEICLITNVQTVRD